MRALAPLTKGGLGVAVSSVLSTLIGSGRVTVVVCCLALLGALGFGIWVLSTNDRTARLAYVIRAIRESVGPAIGPGGKTSGSGKAVEKRGQKS